MKSKTLRVLLLMCITSFTACSQNNEAAKEVKKSRQKKEAVDSKEVKWPGQVKETVKVEPHRYGGWYCPDNLNGFPAVDISDWQNVPVVNGRMATKEETRNGTSLIFVDAEKYPNAKPLDMTMPKLASFYNQSSRREELIIVIQAINVTNDSIVGFRYLNGGNGSARLKEVRFLPENEIETISASQFVSHNIKIEATQDEIWEVLTNPNKVSNFQQIIDEKNELKPNWRGITNVNFHYPKSGKMIASYSDKLYGSFYIQNDYDSLRFNEKFLLLENKEKNYTELKIVCGPYGDDFESQKDIINKWAQKVKKLSEKE